MKLAYYMLSCTRPEVRLSVN